MATLYHRLATDLARDIDNGTYAVGDKLPGIRITSHNKRVSAATAVAAYRQLEMDGYIESRPRSGYYVAQRRVRDVVEPGITLQSHEKPRLIDGQKRVLDLISKIDNPAFTQLGAGVPDLSLLPQRALEKALLHATRMYRKEINIYSLPVGDMQLRRQFSRRMSQIGCPVDAESILITSGCQEAVYLALKTVTEPGDVVAVESPTFHGHLQTINALGLKAIEIPVHPREGISLDALQLAMEQWPIKACIVIPNYNNPLGSCMDDTHKRRLVNMCEKAKVALIEDDIYGDLSFSSLRPTTLKSFDKRGTVLYCSSFSKTISPGLRIGWVSSEKYVEQLAYHKFITNVSAAPLQQFALAHMLRSGMYEKHLRFIRTELEKNMRLISERISQKFPTTTKMTQPAGGYFLWLELPEHIDTLALTDKALAHNVSVAPGPIFSASGKYTNCMRLSCAVAWNDKTRSAIDTLAELIAQE